MAFTIKVVLTTFLLVFSSCGEDAGYAPQFPLSGAGGLSGCGTKGWCYIFVSDTGTQGDFGGVSVADSTCNSDTNKPNSGTYKAMLYEAGTRVACDASNCSAGSAGQVDWVLRPNTQYRRDDGTTVIATTNNNGIFTFPLSNSFDTVGTTYWTGFSTDWISSGSDCASWTSNAVLGSTGIATATNTDAINDGGPSCTSTLLFACVEQP